MGKFLKSLGNVLTTAVAILGLIALILKKLELDALVLSIILLVLLLIGFFVLVIHHNNGIENRIDAIEETYKKDVELRKIKANVRALEPLIIKKWQKKAK